MPGWDDPPIEPVAVGWGFPDPTGARHDLVAVGADLNPGTLLAAYRAGYFPMPHGAREIGWWSPNPRGILPLEGLIVSRSMRHSARRYEIRFDTCVRRVIVECANARTTGNWIDAAFVDAYTELHLLGWVHSVEAYEPGGDLVGGLYGVRIGRFFAGESMFHRSRDASKVALMALVERMNADGMELLDVQWATDHLRSLGAVEVSREEYLVRLASALG